MDKLVEILNSIPAKLMQAVKAVQKNSKSVPVKPETTTGTTMPDSQPVSPEPVPQPSSHQVTQPQSPVAAPVKPNLASLPIKKIAIAFGVIILVLVVLSVVIKLLPKGNGLIPIGPTPSATPVATAPSSTPTQYSDDPEVLNLEQNTKTLDDQLKQIQLDETNLRPRPLDFDVSFK